MHLIKAIIISFSMYSRIPMPQFKWEEDDMKYMLCFFPWVGAVIGGFLFLWGAFCRKFEIGILCYTVIGTAIPLLVTGGFHVDGFMDAMDAFHSYQPKEKKLEILKDAHIGAFAVIMLAVCGLLYMGALSEIEDRRLFLIVCSGFFLARCLSGIGVVTFPSAKNNGLLYMFQSSAHKNIVRISLYLQGILCIGFMLWQSFFAGCAAVACALLVFAYYYFKSKKELGGITGDTAGYFVTMCETAIVMAMAVWNIVFL